MTPTRVAGRRTQQERSEATVGELVAAARDLFAREGYEGASLEDVAATAGVTKGALYHHFAGKRDLFRAVVAEEQRRLSAIVGQAYKRKSDPWDGFYAGCRAFLEASADPVVQRIFIIDAPSVLGWDTIRSMESNTSFAQTISGLKRAMSAGRIPQRPVEPLAHLIFGAVCEGAAVIARAENPQGTLRSVLAGLRTLLDGLATG